MRWLRTIGNASMVAIAMLLMVEGIAWFFQTFVSVARAEHQSTEQINAPQHWPMPTGAMPIAVTGGATAVQLLPANPNRVTAMCQTDGTNTVYYGSTNATNATNYDAFAAAGAGFTVDITDPIFAFATTSSTAHCSEITR